MLNAIRLKPPTLQFAPEWAAILAVVLLDMVWATAIHFHLIVSPRDFLQIGGALAITAAVMSFSLKRMGLIAEYFALTASATGAFAVLSYLALASSGPLHDDALLAADRALGFDWQAGYAFLKGHALPALILKFAYNSMLYQGLYFGVLLALMDDRTRLRQMFWLVLVAGLITSIGVLLWPALGPFKVFHAGPPDSFLPEMERVRAGGHAFELGKLNGVVSFPSFHTTMALAYIWGFRRTGPIAWAIGGVNLLMFCAIPWYGGHYLTDMIGGAIVFAASLLIIKRLPQLKLQARPITAEQPA